MPQEATAYPSNLGDELLLLILNSGPLITSDLQKCALVAKGPWHRISTELLYRAPIVQLHRMRPLYNAIMQKPQLIQQLEGLYIVRPSSGTAGNSNTDKRDFKKFASHYENLDMMLRLLGANLRSLHLPALPSQFHQQILHALAPCTKLHQISLGAVWDGNDLSSAIPVQALLELLNNQTHLTDLTLRWGCLHARPANFVHSNIRTLSIVNVRSLKELHTLSSHISFDSVQTLVIVAHPSIKPSKLSAFTLPFINLCQLSITQGPAYDGERSINSHQSATSQDETIEESVSHIRNMTLGSKMINRRFLMKCDRVEWKSLEIVGSPSNCDHFALTAFFARRNRAANGERLKVILPSAWEQSLGCDYRILAESFGVTVEFRMTGKKGK